MASSVQPTPSLHVTGNGARFAELSGLAHRPRNDPPGTDRRLRSPLLVRLTGRTSIATVAAAGMIVGTLTLVGAGAGTV
jgi:hypothetical protein